MTSPDLIERLEKAEGGSRELDVAICCAVHDGPDWAKEAYFPLKGGIGLYTNGKGGPGLTAPCYTTSLDAALALAERVLPDARAQINTGTGWVRLLTADGRYDYGFFASARAATPALAMCIALLKAHPGNGGTGSEEG